MIESEDGMQTDTAKTYRLDTCCKGALCMISRVVPGEQGVGLGERGSG